MAMDFTSRFVFYGLVMLTVLNASLVGCGGQEDVGQENPNKRDSGGNGIVTPFPPGDGDTIISAKDGTPMALIPAGEFEMGDAKSVFEKDVRG